ncbi:hypothetical protein BGZ98_000668 [Dissophora globulifera]|nr:hypothetical protein BGZ98_000668 [Dissophora globulifera]
MSAQAASTHTIHNDAVTTIVARTTTIVSEHEEIITPEDDQDHQGVRKTLKDYWFPSHAEENEDSEDHANAHGDDDSNIEDDETDGQDHGDHSDPSLLKPNSVMRRAYDYWKSLTQDAEEKAKELVLQAKDARDEAAKEAKWAMFGYKREARERFEAAEQKYRDALAAAEKVHEEAQEKARSKWFQQKDCTQKEVSEDSYNKAIRIRNHATTNGINEDEITHKKWDQFKAAVDSLAFNPPKYACSPSSQFWFSRQNPASDSGWDCREIWDHPGRKDHSHPHLLKPLPKKHLPLEKVHSVFEDLWRQASLKAKSGPSATSFEPTMKSIKEYYQGLLDRIARGEKGAVDELDTVSEKIKGKLHETEYREEQTQAWLMSQWNAVVHNAGEAKTQYERAFKSGIKHVKDVRTETYNTLRDNIQKSLNTARNNIGDAVKVAKDDKTKVHQAIQNASASFSNTLKDAEAKIKSAPKNAYDHAIETFHKDTAQLKVKLEHAAAVASSLSHKASKSASSFSHGASKSVASISRHASKSVSSAAAHASKSSQSIRKDVHDKLHDAKLSVGSIKNRASSEYGRATSSSAYVAPQEMSSVYGAITAFYFLYLARRIWLQRKCCSAAVSGKEVHGDLYVTKKGERRHSHSHSHNHSHHHRHHQDSDESDDQLYHRHRDRHGKHGRHEHGELEEHGMASSSSLAGHSHSHSGHHDNEHRGHHHHHHSFAAVLETFTSVVPVTMTLLVLLELAGFTRIGLHTLFAGLVASQVIRGGYLNGLMEHLGILDSALGETVAGENAVEIGNTLAWTVFGLACAANVIKALHEQ